MKQEDVTREQFGSLLDSIHHQTYGIESLDRTKLKYIVYLRKSTEGGEKQQKSIRDQFSDIKERVLEPNKINFFKKVEEEKSAKVANTRSKFSEVLTDLKTGKYQGLIAWHPDRLTRNMQEAGEIIEMLDSNCIKDLLFATAIYERNANGKMMLGITFVLSKQYSEHLSESVVRGYGKRNAEGKYLGKRVHGYKIIEDGILAPDDNNYLIIQGAYQKRLEKESLKEIASWLNKQPYTQCYGREQKRSTVVFDDKKLSDLFRDTIYVGFLHHGQAKPVDITKLYDFVPMITVEEYEQINKSGMFDRAFVRGNVVRRRIRADILRNEVHCGHCGHKMYTTTGMGNHGKTTYVYFRCDYKRCAYKANNNRGIRHQIRANVVTNYAVDILRNTQFDLGKAYKLYVVDAKKALEDQGYELNSEERRIRADITEAEKQLKRAKDTVSDPDNKDVAELYRTDIKNLTKHEIPNYKQRLQEIKTRKEGLRGSVVSEEKFIKLMQNTGSYLSKLKDIEQIDVILKKFFSNFVIKDRSVSEYTFKEPWNKLANRGWLPG